MWEIKCENCSYFKVIKEFFSIDCLSPKIDPDSYFEYIGEGEKGCPYFKSKNI